jgi:hypothetical protein
MVIFSLDKKKGGARIIKNTRRPRSNPLNYTFRKEGKCVTDYLPLSAA